MTSWRSVWGGGTPGPAARYVAALMAEPESAEVTWLAAAATRGDEDRAKWELRYLRRALGLVIAQRDALDDRTASDVGRALREAMQSDRNVAPAMLAVADRQFNDRLGSYRDMMGLKGQHSAPEERAARTLLLLAESPRLTSDDLEHATQLCTRYVADLRGALRDAFGSPRLTG